MLRRGGVAPLAAGRVGAGLAVKCSEAAAREHNGPPYPRGFAHRTPQHALTLAGSPARSVRVAHSLFARSPRDGDGLLAGIQTGTTAADPNAVEPL
jgi:hypothetical protein